MTCIIKCVILSEKTWASVCLIRSGPQNYSLAPLCTFLLVLFMSSSHLMFFSATFLELQDMLANMIALSLKVCGEGLSSLFNPSSLAEPLGVIYPWKSNVWSTCWICYGLPQLPKEINWYSKRFRLSQDNREEAAVHTNFAIYNNSYIQYSVS